MARFGNYTINQFNQIKEALSKLSRQQQRYLCFTIVVIALIVGIAILRDSFNQIKASNAIPNLVSSLKPKLPEAKIGAPKSSVLPETQKDAQNQAVSGGANTVNNGQPSWQPLHSLLASTPARRIEALQQLHLAKGNNIIACFSIKCSDCEREALKLNSYSSTNSIIGIAIAPQADINQWRKKLSLEYPIVSVSEALFEDIGAVILPTIIKVNNSQVTGVTDDAQTLANKE